MSLLYYVNSLFSGKHLPHQLLQGISFCGLLYLTIRMCDNIWGIVFPQILALVSRAPLQKNKIR